ncbi:fructose-specific PTS transporter subunit EIIC [Spiroplasma sp. DGKH1]|uniref:fructose-specific PTS transporter subunit EIIC n=1 Tax=Spiroplasma sp. DGKH1 TaxID=3050074 RepID=UPI0034C674D5
MKSNDLFDQEHIILDSQAKTQQEAFVELAELAKKLGCVDEASDLVAGFKAREAESSTGFEDGFAIPHARIKAVKKPAVLFVRYQNPLDWNAMDGKPTNIAIALVIPEDKSADIHLGLLSDIARKLMDADFKKAMKTETDKAKIQEALMGKSKKEEPVTTTSGSKLILGISACPTGIAHTFLAADKLTQAGPKLGYTVKVETHGSEGIRNNFTDDEIQRAEVIVAAVDIAVDMSRFGGKRVYTTSTSKAIKDPEGVINTALKEAKVQAVGEFNTSGDKNSGQRTGIMKHLMSGVSYMVPIVILGGIFIALALGLSKAIYGASYQHYHGSFKDMEWVLNPGQTIPTWQAVYYTDPTADPQNFFYYLLKLGSAAFTLMIPILGAFIANSIAGRAAIAPALVVSFIGNDASAFFPIAGIGAVDTPTGFVGAILAGLAVGYTVKWINTWKVPKSLRPVMPIFVIPVLVGFVYGMIMMFVVGLVVGYVMHQFKWWISTTWGNPNNAAGLGIGFGFGLLIGAMAGFDMGGPINKVAFLACTGLIGSKVYTPMGAMACAIPVAPLGMGMATWIFRPLYNDEQKAMGSSAFFMGCIGISEGAIPFAINDPKRAIVCNVVSSAIAGAVAGLLGIADAAAHGGPIVALVGAIGRGNDGQLLGWGTAWGWTLLSLVIMFGGATINAFMYGTWMIIDKKRTGETISMKEFVLKTRADKVAAKKANKEVKPNKVAKNNIKG